MLLVVDWKDERDNIFHFSVYRFPENERFLVNMIVILKGYDVVLVRHGQQCFITTVFSVLIHLLPGVPSCSLD